MNKIDLMQVLIQKHIYEIGWYRTLDLFRCTGLIKVDIMDKDNGIANGKYSRRI